MFEIICNDKIVGTAEVEKEGLYYRIQCVCTPPNMEIHRIYVSDGQRKRDLGICVPIGTNFALTTRIPTKYLNGENLRFFLVQQNAGAIPVETDMEFYDLDKLETARLQVTNGQAEVIIDSAQDQPDSDQSQEFQHKSEWQ